MADKTIIVSMLNFMQIMQHTMMGLQQTVLKLASKKSQNKEDNSLKSAYADMSTSNHDQHSDNLVPTSTNTNGGYRLAFHQNVFPTLTSFRAILKYAFGKGNTSIWLCC